MQVNSSEMKVKDLTGDYRKTITVNTEYQRGEVWSDEQKRKLIDSILRGYQLPFFYLHEIVQSNSRGDTWRVHQIIDGQQRCNALDQFINGDLQLYDATDENTKLPSFLRDTEKYPCPWGGKRFKTLPEDLQERLLTTQLPVAFITEADDYEVRDLFIRLQSGSSLNNQEKRDAYPGQFSQFIVELGGKPSRGYNGYDFFKNLIRLQGGSDRGQIRELAARITMLFLGRREIGGIVATSRENIDEFYDTKQDFDATAQECRRLLDVIGRLEQLLAGWTGPKLVGHNAIALVLFVDSIWDDYTRAWEAAFADALQRFLTFYEEGRLANREGRSHAAWLNYGQYANASSVGPDRVRRRQEFFDSCMVGFLGDGLVPLDPKRAFNDLEKRSIFWRDGGQCRVCDSAVPWHEAVFHHVKQHKDGGRTVVNNGALVHGPCHPLSEEAVAEFATSFQPYTPRIFQMGQGNFPMP